ncbi:EPIDERMAL PATTERNING FACTOR-like protein 2 [Triticum dicoccoides]|uniref:EPIDERMAL PATTERNING FACTOR-like protein 2 n=1 Tax=Triticum dicoccoides TaxID=85692 RepID=UPI00188EF4A6|nr:EPIDERMAL PATTERNING FACTOR-like protein 2 [Triticum dicoccoides]
MGHLLLLLLALLLASTRAAAFHASAAAFAEDKGIAGIRGVIGSRPPSCAGRCRSCGHCEAVQVPISPQELGKRKKRRKELGRHGSRAAEAGGGGRRAMPSSYDDHSNYKPLSWRCKCGRLILTP